MLDRRLRVLLLLGTDMLSSYADATAVGRGTRAAGPRRQLRPLLERHRAAVRRRGAPGDVVARGARLQEHQHASLPDAEDPGARRATRSPSRACCASSPSGSDVDGLLPVGERRRSDRRDPRSSGTGHATVARPREEGGMRALAISPVAHPDLDVRDAVRQGRVLLRARRVRSASRPCRCTTTCRRRRFPLTLRQGRTLDALPRLLRSRPRAADAGDGRSRAGAVDRARRCGRARDRGWRADPHVQRARRDAGAGPRDRRVSRRAPSGCATAGTASTALTSGAA